VSPEETQEQAVTKERKTRVVLTDSQWVEIAQRISCGDRQGDVARSFGVTQSTVSRVLSGENRSGLMSKAPKHECAVCGTRFTPSRANQDLCGKACVLERRRLRYAERVRGGYRQYEKKRDLLRATKDKPCMDCGTYYPGEPDLMDLDHRDPLTKSHKMVRRPGRTGGGFMNLPMAELVSEIAKCDLVCAICHRRRSRRVTSGSVVRPGKRRPPGRRPRPLSQLPLLAAVA
jgi:hypothetical protein